MVYSKVCSPVKYAPNGARWLCFLHTEYYTSHPPFNNSSPIAIAAVGTVGLGIQYGEVHLLTTTAAI